MSRARLNSSLSLNPLPGALRPGIFFKLLGLRRTLLGGDSITVFATADVRRYEPIDVASAIVDPAVDTDIRGPATFGALAVQFAH
jgi:hypothetical protein